MLHSMVETFILTSERCRKMCCMTAKSSMKAGCLLMDRQRLPLHSGERFQRKQQQIMLLQQQEAAENCKTLALTD